MSTTTPMRETMFKDYPDTDGMPTPTTWRAPAIPPKAPPPPCPATCNRAADPAERVALIQQELAEAEAALAAKNERDALAAKYDVMIVLVGDKSAAVLVLN